MMLIYCKENVTKSDGLILDSFTRELVFKYSDTPAVEINV